MVIHGGYFCPTVPGLPWACGHARTLIRNVLYLINNRAARSFRYTILPVGSRSRLRSYSDITAGITIKVTHIPQDKIIFIYFMISKFMADGYCYNYRKFMVQAL